ncbi:ion transporter [Mycobacterium colombiense]|uniref:Ion transport protein n=1 Tax=Mycobacterium colombiense CECT 3035 TaxID=1041522 RepID=J4TG02_9MYCO|nr:ion transporter [Mycobacterium colombiense]EJO88058.1 Ion transport protein [Mycobacterium colombiense CECT 3035]
MTARWFDQTVTGAIIANVGVLIAGQLIDGHEELFELAHDVILSFFVVELGVHLRMHGWRFLRKPLNAFDAAVIAASCLPMFGLDGGLLRLARAARLLHVVRHLPHLRLIRFVPIGRLAPVLAAERE